MTGIVARYHNKSGSKRVDPSMMLWPVLSASDCPALDMVYTTIDGVHSRRVNRRSTKIYFVTKGKLIVRCNGDSLEFSEKDVCVVPPGVWCELEGISAEVAIICAPPFNRDDETKT